jgi:hypothetical protein
MTALALASARIVDAVHQGGDCGPFVRIALQLPAPPGVDRWMALVTVLAAQADPIASLQQRLGWVRRLDPQLREAS